MWNSSSAHLEKAYCAKRCLNRLHLWVLSEQHMLDTRFTVVERTVPRYMVATAKCVFWIRVNKKTNSFVKLFKKNMQRICTFMVASPAQCFCAWAFNHEWEAVVHSYISSSDSTVCYREVTITGKERTQTSRRMSEKLKWQTWQDNFHLSTVSSWEATCTLSRFPEQKSEGEDGQESAFI